jgi:hypothetical protein
MRWVTLKLSFFTLKIKYLRALLIHAATGWPWAIKPFRGRFFQSMKISPSTAQHTLSPYSTVVVALGWESADNVFCQIPRMNAGSLCLASTAILENQLWFHRPTHHGSPKAAERKNGNGYHMYVFPLRRRAIHPRLESAGFLARIV